MLHSGLVTAKLLSGNTLTSLKSTFSWGCRALYASYIVAKATDSIKQPLNLSHDNLLGVMGWQAVCAEALHLCRNGMELNVRT